MRAPAAVKRFVAAHFPDKLPIAQLEHLAEMVLEQNHDDLELLRVSLLSALAGGTLDERALASAESLYPGDRGAKGGKGELIDTAHYQISS